MAKTARSKKTLFGARLLKRVLAIVGDPKRNVSLETFVAGINILKNLQNGRRNEGEKIMPGPFHYLLFC